MQPALFPANPKFIGRSNELKRLAQISTRRESSIIVVHGRRRIGKTELIEQFFRERNVLKFEGIEGGDERTQKLAFLIQLSHYTRNSEVTRLADRPWLEILGLLANQVQNGTWTIYLEELQWLASYRSTFIGELKFIWDNRLRHNPELILILCGSSPSFMVGQVVRSKALYSRSLHEIPLKPFSLAETAEYLGLERHSPLLLDCYLTVGGIPEYLNYLKADNSPLVALCKESFIPGGYFTGEYERIFVSSLGDKAEYRSVVSFLAEVQSATRAEIAQALGVTAGGNFSKLLEELERSDFIESYQRFDQKRGSGATRLKRFAIKDNFLQYHARFIGPLLPQINNGKFTNNPSSALPLSAFRQWLGYAFERYMRANEHLIAKTLGFEGISYQSGPFFERGETSKAGGLQIDLLFDRKDGIFTVCEAKYRAERVGVSVIDEVERKIERFPNKKNRPIQRILIAPQGVTQELADRLYFDSIIGIEPFFS